jgi:hypothetical protein
MKRKDVFPEGWDDKKVQALIDYYEKQTDEEALAEDEFALEDPTQTWMQVPNELVPAVRELIAKYETSITASKSLAEKRK